MIFYKHATPASRMYNKGLNLIARLSAAVAAITLTVMLPPPAHAQRTTSQLPVFGRVTLSPSFSPDPTVVRGISGGSASASEIAGRAETPTGPCIGFVDEQPDHTLVLTEFFNYLNVQVQSAQDTTLVVRGPGGSWCNDDYDNTNPGIAGQWLEGTYQIWVGSYGRNQYHPYLLRFTEVR